MAFDWASQGALFTGKLTIKSMGPVGNNAPFSQQIVTNNATVTYVDNTGKQAQIAEGVSGSNVMVTKSGDTPANAYILPWSAGYASKTQLAMASPIFVTPDLNGCAVFISGDVTSPTVVHINSQAALLDQGEPAFVPAKKGATLSETTAGALKYGRDLTAFKESSKNPMWDAVYQALAIKLVGANLIPKANLKLLLPTDYLAADVGSASVFGYCAGAWSFYCNANGKTRQIWP